MSEIKKPSRLKIAFNYAAGVAVGFKNTLLSISRISLKAVMACAAISAVGMLGDPDWTTTDLEEYAADQDLPETTFDNIDHEKIRVYQKKNPLLYFKLAGDEIVQASATVIKYPSFADLNDSGHTTKLELAATIGKFVAQYPAVLYRAAVLGIDLNTDPLNAFAMMPQTDEQTCLIMPPGQMDAETFIKRFTGLKAEDLREFKITPREINEFIMLHEARHCDRIYEHGADTFALENMSADAPNRQEMIDTIKHLRAISTFSRTYDNGKVARDTTHATALSIEMWQMGVPFESWENMINLSTNGLYTLLDERKDQYTDLPQPMRIKKIMQDLLDSGELDHAHGMKRSAEMYIEGIEFFTNPEFENTPENNQPVIKIFIGSKKSINSPGV